MFQTRRFPVLILPAFLIVGCGGEAPAPEPRPPAAPRPAVAAPAGPPPDFDSALRALVPQDVVLYMAGRAEALAKARRLWLPDLDGESAGPPAPGLASVLRALGTTEGAPGPFSGPTAIGLAPAPSTTAVLPLDFWIATDSGPRFDAALATLGPPAADGSRRIGSTRTFVARHGAVAILASRPAWLTAGAGGCAWIEAARARLPGRSLGYAVLSPGEYHRALERTFAARAPGEGAWVAAWARRVPGASLSLEELGETFRCRLALEVDPADPEAREWTRLLTPAASLGAWARIPAVARAALVGSLDWKELLGRVRPTLEPPSGASVPPGPAATGPAALWAGVADPLMTALTEWAGPELALSVVWDAREPDGTLLLATRDPKRAAAAVQRFHQTGPGARLTFVGGNVHGSEFRYTRLDGVDPRWLEPTYGFHGGYLALASRRPAFEAMADPGGEKLESREAVAGLAAAMGERVALALFLDPAVLPRVAGLGQGTRSGAIGVLERLAETLSGLALGVGPGPHGGLEAVLVLVRPASTGEDDVGSPVPGGSG